MTPVFGSVMALIGNSITMYETLVPLNVSEGWSGELQSPAVGTYGAALNFLKHVRSKKKASSRWPAKLLMPPWSLIFGAGAAGSTESGVTSPVIAPPGKPVIVYVC